MSVSHRRQLAMSLLGSTLAPSMAHAENGTDTLPPRKDDAGDEIQVTGVRSLTSDKIPDGVLNAAQTIAVIPQPVLEHQATSRLPDALKNVPRIKLNAGECSAPGAT